MSMIRLSKLTQGHFSNFDEFELWKTDFEKTSNSTFVLHSAPNILADHQCYYFYCDRSGTYNSRGKGK